MVARTQRARPANTRPATVRHDNCDEAPLEELRARAGWIISLRWLAVLGIVAAAFCPRLLHAIGYRSVSVKWRELLICAAVVLLYNIAFYAHQHRLQGTVLRQRLGLRLRRFANVQIALDLAMITVCLHFSGGAENPFVMFYVFHVIIASALLTRSSSFLQAGLGAALFAVLVASEAILPEFHHPLWTDLPFELHTRVPFLLSEIVALGITLTIAAYLAHSIAGKEHEREAELEAIRDNLEGRTAELTAVNAELARLQEVRSHFLRVAAHQLRSPLAAIASCLSTVESGLAKTPEKRDEMIQRAASRARSLGVLVSDLLTLSHTRSVGIRRSDMMPICFDRLIERSVELHRPGAQAKCIELTWAPGCGQAEVLASDRAMMDVIGNLLSNAVKYTPPGGKACIKTFRDGERICCQVTDTGIGIPKDEVDQLFKEFFRASNARREEVEGTGLGLAIVKETLAAHGGDIQASSLPGLGTMFVFHLPAVRTKQAASELRVGVA